MTYRVELIGGPADGQVVESDWTWPHLARWEIPVQYRESSWVELYDRPPDLLSMCSDFRAHRYGPGIRERKGRYFLLSEHIKSAEKPGR